jgi:hypothetical protein
MAVTGVEGVSALTSQPLPAAFGADRAILAIDPEEPPPLTTSPAAQSAVTVAVTDVGDETTR